MWNYLRDLWNRGRGSTVVLRKTLRIRSPLSGYTLIEIFVVAFIVLVISGALLVTLKVGNLSFPLSSAKAEIQAEVRRTMGWITEDVRKSVTWDMANAANSPSETHIKFRQVQGWNTTAEALILSSNYVEYEYDTDTQTITRYLLDSGGNVTNSWRFNNITAVPFYTWDTIGDMVALNSGDLLASNVVIIALTADKSSKMSPTVSYNLTSEVKIRNE